VGTIWQDHPHQCYADYYNRFHSINVPSEWGPDDADVRIKTRKGFHSINVPSEWGPAISKPTPIVLEEEVSIQLMSPVSGDQLQNQVYALSNASNCFHSINVPSEWGLS
jgi:hypothetical protein